MLRLLIEQLTDEAKPRPSTAATGFSLIEILVVISIMAIIGAIVMVGLQDYGERQVFRTAVTDVRDGIASARQQTIASVNDTLYGVHVSSTAVVLFEGATFVEGDADNIVFDLPSNLSATTALSGGVNTVTFARLTGMPSAAGTITFSDAQSDANATITISSTGLIQ